MRVYTVLERLRIIAWAHQSLNGKGVSGDDLRLQTTIEYYANRAAAAERVSSVRGSLWRNPYDLGARRNWDAVFGPIVGTDWMRPLVWLLPRLRPPLGNGVDFATNHDVALHDLQVAEWLTLNSCSFAYKPQQRQIPRSGDSRQGDSFPSTAEEEEHTTLLRQSFPRDTGASAHRIGDAVRYRAAVTHGPLRPCGRLLGWLAALGIVEDPTTRFTEALEESSVEQVDEEAQLAAS